MDIAQALHRYWGHTSLRPLQAEAVDAQLAGQDSLVVLPTGGGKSLCYQLPAVLRDGLSVVVSPLIALMKDQVDGLRLDGYPAGALHGGASNEEAADVRRAVADGTLRLLYVSPERLLSEGTLDWLRRSGVVALSIDEAHCISQWGHDFRPEYRRLGEVRQALGGVPFHAYTATATPRVREDIAAQLGMKDPAILVGTFDRPNLSYRVLPRVGDGLPQVEAVLRRHAGEAAIVYCISRRQTEDLADALKARGLNAAAYHAGLDGARRSRVQEDFLSERLDIVVATVAFGMGIDRGDVRAVIHASMPKSVEAYQQETGRAGRDGLPSECVLFYSSSDAMKWTQLIERGGEVDPDPLVIEAQVALVRQMQRFASGARCRHRALSEYFGQALAEGACGACDVCNAELEEIADSTTIARKILSCVVRLRGQRDDAFGAAYVADVLRGSNQARIRERRHDELSTFGLLKDHDKDAIVSFIDQLVDRGAIVRDTGPYPVLLLAPPAGPILRGEVPIQFFRAKVEMARRRAEGPEAELFEELRALRRTLAAELDVPPYVVFADTTLQEMARVRPSTADRLGTLKGVGTRKLEQFGERFLAAIGAWCARAGAEPDQGEAPRPKREPTTSRAATAARRHAFAMFAEGLSIDEVARRAGRARSTTAQMLTEWITSERPGSIAPWVDAATQARVEATITTVGADRLKPVFDALGGTVDYETLRIVAAFRRG